MPFPDMTPILSVFERHIKQLLHLEYKRAREDAKSGYIEQLSKLSKENERLERENQRLLSLLTERREPPITQAERDEVEEYDIDNKLVQQERLVMGSGDE